MKITYTPEQQRVLDAWGQGMAVTAGAGTGKSTTIVGKCAELLRRNSKARFAAVSFTEKSAADLRSKLTQSLRGEGLWRDEAGHWISTVHGLCAQVIRDHPEQAGLGPMPRILDEAEAKRLWDQALQSLWSDQLPDPQAQALEYLLERHRAQAVEALLGRMRALEAQGVVAKLLGTGSDGEKLAVVGAHVLARFEQLKRRQGGMDFADLERGALAALGHAPVARGFHQRFDLVLVDEFQDTNPVQCEIVRRFAKPAGENLCVVGDPKQSIYRFRDADVASFEAFRRELPLQAELSVNRRSRPEILAWTNRVFAPLLAASGLEYQPLTAAREEGGADSVLRLEVRSPDELGRWLRRQQEWGLEQTVLLLRKIRGNERWLKALASQGIALSVGGGGLFWSDPRVVELVAFLKFWEEPENRLSGLTFLRAPWVGVGDAELDAWMLQGRLHSGFFSASSPGHPVARRLRPFLGKPARPGELLLALSDDDRVHAEIGAPLLGLWHRCEQWSSQGLRFDEIARLCARNLEEGRREADVPPPGGQGLLRVMTVHASKGLEFEQVILVDFRERPERANFPTLYMDRELGAYLPPRETGFGELKTPELENHKGRERAKAVAESKRLFYVAVTRARDRVVFVTPPSSPVLEKEEDGKPSQALERDHWLGWLDELGGLEARPAVTDPEEVLPDWPQTQASQAPDHALDRSPAVPSLARRPRHSATEWADLARCARLYEWTWVRPQFARGVAPWRPDAVDEEEATDGGAASSMTGRELGTAVHEALAEGDAEALRALERTVGRKRLNAEALIRWHAASPLLRASGGVKLHRELAFEWRLGSELVVGAMDLVVETPDLIRVLDFKILRSAPDPEDLVAKYQVQMEVYGAAMEALTPGKRVETWLVAASGEVLEIPVERGRVDLRALAARAQAVVGGGPAQAQPSSHCGRCLHRLRCPEGRW